MPPLTRATMPDIPADCYWHVERNGSRRNQPIRIEVRQAAEQHVTEYQAGKRTTIPLSSILAWDYSTGEPGDFAEVAKRLAKSASNVRDITTGIIA